jgi:putative nucleotidyltransferase with HDIG domain
MATALPDPPSRDACLDLMERYGMLPHIRDHSMAVCRVSMAIGRALASAGEPIDLELLEAAALLHDITKTRSLETREDHAETGEALLVELGCPRTGKVVGEHIVPVDRGDRLTEAEIVAYADKRVVHDRIVGLDERFEYLKDTYGRFPEAMAYFDEMRLRMERIEALVEEVTGAPVPDDF